MLLDGFGYSGYRSVGEELIRIAPLKKVNFIIGQNNAGKSNIINFLSEQYPYLVSRVPRQRTVTSGANNDPFNTEIDEHKSDKNAKFRIAFPMVNNSLDHFINEKLPDQKKFHAEIQFAKKLLTSEQFVDGDGNSWFTYKSDTPNGPLSLDLDITKVSSILNKFEWQRLWSTLTGKFDGDLAQHWIPQTLYALSYVPTTLPKVEVIPAIRKVGSAGTEASDYSGEGIIERLAKIQNPSLMEQSSKSKFGNINTFVQDVLENSSATLEIPYDRDMILVHMDGTTLPLESHGTGVHEVVIIAAGATLLDKAVLCVEEPELHLHPLLQRKLIKYLSENTDNQYIFTTHSAHLLDAVEAEIFHIVLNNGVSQVNPISSTKHRSNICYDLGYKASDLLQANCIIWVEGPSDRIYINYWLHHKNPDMIEGIHYSVMFYGGRLFSHLTAMDDDEIDKEIEDFISVRNLNRNSVIMFDSDKKSSRAKISKTKTRLKTEFNSGDGFSWITEGREIENYLDSNKVEESVLAVHPSATSLLGKGQWDNLLKYKKKNSTKDITANKVKVARHYISKNVPDLRIFDLEERLEQLCSFISKANGNEI